MMVSAIVPLHNKAAYIRRALDSVVAQAFTDFEVIVVDDGSTDGGAALAAAYGPRIRLVSQSNEGPSAARNRGLQEARGDWVAFLDADDEWLPRFLERTAAVARQMPSLVSVFTNFGDAVTGRSYLRRVRCVDGVVQDYFQVLLDNGGFGMSSSSTMVRRDALRASGGFRPGVRYGQDRDLWGRLALSGSVAYVPEVLAIYHSETPDSLTKETRRADPIYPPFARSYEELRKAGAIPPGLRDTSRRFVNSLVLAYAVELLNRGNKARASAVLSAECRPEKGTRARYLGAYARLVLPTSFLVSARSLKHRLSGRPRSDAHHVPAGPTLDTTS
jgi:glycosyltransferase involved in cell wall biosynthesis